jgi:Ca2+-binding EF-hand superfamily protein
LCGLSKRLFFGELAANGVALSEQEKALFSQVFALDSAPGKLDYLKLDQAFEGEQQHLYALEEFYTVEWERRVFRKIGEYLKKHNLTIETCFDLIDDDGSQTASFAELKQALARFDLRLSDQQVQAFLARLGEPGAAHIGRDAFIKRFWSAFTYDDVRTDQEPGASAASKMVPGGSSGAADGGRIASGLQQKLQQLRMLRAIQERIKAALAATEAFTALDSGVGFLTLGDFQAGLPLHFDLTLRQHEVSALFAEVDSDGNGVVKYAEWDGFYRMNFDQRVRELESEKERLVTQHDIFDHLLKVLKQKGLTLEEMFDQIDLDKNQFIEVDEFHQTLECMGFLISEEQVFELMRQMDDNFDGRISYAELRAHILRLGFQLDKTLESRSRGGAPAQVTTFAWRDKGLELIIQALHRKLEG